MSVNFQQIESVYLNIEMFKHFQELVLLTQYDTDDTLGDMTVAIGTQSCHSVLEFLRCQARLVYVAK